MLFQILFSLTVVSFSLLSFSYFTKLIEFKKFYLFSSVAFFFITIFYFLFSKNAQQIFPAFKFTLILMFSFAIPILFLMKKIIEFRIKNFVDNNKQNQGLLDLYIVFKKLESYSFVFFLVMVVIYQLLLIWIPEILDGIQQ